MGDTYWVSTQAPNGTQDPTSEIGSSVSLGQTQVFHKIGDAGSLTIVVSKATLETIDQNPHALSSLDCPPLLNNNGLKISDGCIDAIDTYLKYSIKASKDLFVKDALGNDQWLGELDLTHGDVFAELHGYIDNWHPEVGPGADSNLHFKVAPDIEYNDNVNNDVDRTHARMRLSKSPIIEIPLDAVKKDETFSVTVDITATAINHRQLESYAGAFFRDPQKSSGLSYLGQGVELVAIPVDLVQVPPPANVQPAPLCAGGTDPAAGMLQFESAQFYTSEARVAGTTLVSITRSGGGKGEVSAAITTQYATAHSGTDYQTVSTIVRFDAGEQGKRYLAIPIIDNKTPEADRSLTVNLSDPRGCVALGAQTQTVLTILDDDQPQPVTQFTVGGTITGLAGSGLVLREVSQGGPLAHYGWPVHVREQGYHRYAL
jgi:Calx-beta domain